MKTPQLKTAQLRGSRRRHVLLGGAILAALAAAAIAAAGPGLSGSSSLVAASFYANTLGKSHTQTCTATNSDALAVTDATFTGTATSTDSRLAGPISIHVKSVYDSTTNVGSLTGNLDISGTTSPPSHGHVRVGFSAVNANGNVQGFVAGGLGSGVELLGSFSATFSPTGGFSSSTTQAMIGAGNTSNTAILTGAARCASPNPPSPHTGSDSKPPKPDNDGPGHGRKHHDHH